MVNHKANVKNAKCKTCGQIVGERPILVGDILTFTAPSGMPRALAKLLSTEKKYEPRMQDFAPVVVVKVLGELIGVVPLSWKGMSFSHDYHELAPELRGALSWLLTDYGSDIRFQYGQYGFWVWAWASHPELYQEGK